MGDPRGFLKFERQTAAYRPVCERVNDYLHVSMMRDEGLSRDQSARCMDCGVPFCHWGCPVGNYIPEWNSLVESGHWGKALELLEASNNFPEITGRVCPATCEYACILGINDDPVTIRENELAIIEHAFEKGIVKPRPPRVKTGKKVAVIGSGPAGLACAQQLCRAGHTVTVYEKDDKPGGILRYGIPDFKLEKRIIDRRLALMEREGVEFRTSVNVGIDESARKILDVYAAVCLSGGSNEPRDLNIGGRGLSGIYFAMDYLTESNRRVSGAAILPDKNIDVKGKKVVVIGGGDTGADCVGTACRQGASCVVQVEVMPKPAECRTEEHPWPVHPVILKTTSSHEEGAERDWRVLTKKFAGEGGRVKKIECTRVEFVKDPGMTCPAMKEIPGSSFSIDAEIVIIAIGFMRPRYEGLLSELGVGLDERGNVKTGDNYMTSVKKVFAAGDMRRGQSLIVWAISEGRRAARHIDEYLMGSSELPVL